MATKKMVLSVVGSGTTYLPDFCEILIQRRDELQVAKWQLMDIDPIRLETTGNFVKKMIADAGLETEVFMTTNLEEGVKDADFVITTIRSGGPDMRILDETVPLKYNMIGQETTAPGGMMMGLRDIPEMLKIAEAMEKYSKPNVWLINLANPSGMLAEALNQYSNVNFAGLCNGPTVIRNAMKAIYAPENPEDVFVEVIGLNHLIWCKVFYKGEDVTEEAITKLLDWTAENIPYLRTEFAEKEIMEFAGWIPMGPYLRFYYNYPGALNDFQHQERHWPKMVEMVKKNVGGFLDDLSIEDLPTRAHMVKEVDKRTMELYRNLDMDGYKLATNTRGGKGYGEAGLALISAIWNNKGEIHGPDVRSRGTIEGLDPTTVATTTSYVDGSGIHPLAFPAMPRHMISKIQAAKQYELLACEAAVTGDYNKALEALIANPLVGNQYYDIKGCLDELLIKQVEFLPNFKDAVDKLRKGEIPCYAKEIDGIEQDVKFVSSQIEMGQ